MTLGRPVIAFSVGGVADQIGESGKVLPPLDVEGFADEVTKLLSSKPERDRLGAAAARRVAEMYSTRTFTASLGDLLDRARPGG